MHKNNCSILQTLKVSDHKKIDAIQQTATVVMEKSTVSDLTYLHFNNAIQSQIKWNKELRYSSGCGWWDDGEVIPSHPTYHPPILRIMDGMSGVSLHQTKKTEENT